MGPKNPSHAKEIAMKLCTKLLRRLALVVLLAALLTVAALAADAEAANADEFYTALETLLRAQDDNFSIAYTGDRAELALPDDGALGACLRNMSARSGDGPDSADYPALNVADGQMGWLAGAYYFDIDYLATPAQIDEVIRQAGQIVSGLQLDGEDDYTKVKLLYEYVCTHFVYDDTLTKFSAYDGLTTGSMVCQGYALLTYELMWNAGIPCRIVTGTSRQQNHAWNIVELDGRWYNLDTTWDAAQEIGGIMSWDYFLRSEEEFGGHTRFTPYTTDAYQQSHPMAAESWELPQITVVFNGSRVGSLALRADAEVQLEVELPDGMDASDIRWTSSDPSQVQITEDGTISAGGLGSAVLTAEAAQDRGVISAQVPVQVVELRTASSWAYPDVLDYYLAQLLPVSLCEDFQSPITRGELARMLYQFVRNTQGWDAMVIDNPFTDIASSADLLAILRCYSVGLMEGTSDTTFSPDAPVTREQAAVVLARLTELLDGAAPEPAAASYRDEADIHDWAAEAVGAMTGAGVLQGVDGGAFSPRTPMTLEQMIVALYRVYSPRAELLSAEAA